ncbi:TonB-dependent receptor [Croceicoccus bisphenolivorans]|uniref:TonB-dependent receptor n=1 Tax=Croceicoccus bisphenolivorans TaxID=1783232 RepID=UPI00083007DC|nr:TonB-dependent receptor [Croceicoccus bisphenolivorans]
MKITTIRKRALQAGSALNALALVGIGATAVALPTVASAQDYTNVTATGRVIDDAGAPIAGATVTITSDSQGFSRTSTTDSSGSYRIPALPQGAYTFTVTAPSYGTYIEKGITLNQDTGGNSFQLVPASGATASGNEIIVTGARIRVSDFDRTTVGAVVDVQELSDRVPIARDLTSVVLLAPGTTSGDTAFGNLPALAGGSVSENTYFFNGLNITDFRQGLGSVEVPFSFYDTVEVKNGGVPAEFGRFTGGFVNAISKSGSNELHGGALISYAPSWGYEQAPNTLIDYNAADYNEEIESTFYLSGPIIKDRLFAYAFYSVNYNRNDDILTTSNPNTVLQPESMDDEGNTIPADIDPVTGQPVLVPTTVAPYATGSNALRRTFNKPYYGGKIDFLPFDGHRFELTYFNSSQSRKDKAYDVVDADGGAYDSRLDDAAYYGPYTSTSIYESGGENYVGRYTGQFTDWLTLSAAYGKNKRRDNVSSTQPDYAFILDSSGDFTPTLSGNPVNIIETNNDTREFYRADADVYVDFVGKHHFKFGYDREKLTTFSLTSYTGGVAYEYFNSGSGDTYTSIPDLTYVSARTFENGGTFKSDNEAFYIQDSWSLLNDRLTLNLGIRNDRFSNDNVNGETYYESGDAWAPRLAFTADPFGDGRTKVYGSFSRYYLPIAANTNIRLAGAELDYTRYFAVAGVNPDGTPIYGDPLLGFENAQACPDSGVENCELISDGVATPTEATVAKNLKPQSTDEFVLGLEHSLSNRIRVGLFGIYRKLNESLEDIAVDAAVNAYCEAENIEGCDSVWTGFHQYVLVNPGAGATITLSDPIDGEDGLRTVDFSAEDLGYPKAKRTYKAITATFDRSFDGKWGAGANYTYSVLKGNIEGGIRSDNGQTDSGLTTAFDQPGLTNGAYGYLPGHSRHQFKFYGSYAPTEWFTLGLQAQVRSPRKFGCIGRVPRQVDPYAGAYGAAGFYCNLDESGNVITDPNYSGFSNNYVDPTSLSVTPRGSRLESDWTTFVNLSGIFKVPSDDINATFRIDVFNLFNSQAVTDIRELGTQDSGRPRGDYGYPLGYQTPRSIRFQFGVDF